MADELFDWEDVRAEVLDPADEPEVARLREFWARPRSGCSDLLRTRGFAPPPWMVD